MDPWIWTAGFMANPVLGIIWLIAFKIAHNTHRQNRKSDHSLLFDAMLIGGEDLVKAVGEAATGLAEARGKPPRPRRFEFASAMPWAQRKAQQPAVPNAPASTHKTEQQPAHPDALA